jgi:hypothetical protein
MTDRRAFPQAITLGALEVPAPGVSGAQSEHD